MSISHLMYKYIILDYCGNNMNPCFAGIVFASTAGAAENQGSRLGEYVQIGINGRVFYQQKETEADEGHYLFFEQNAWRVSTTLGGGALLWNGQTTDLPPQNGWHYLENGKWKNSDTTLALETELTSLVLSACQLVQVEGDANIMRLHSSRMGNYELQSGRWSAGRPVYQQQGQLRYLMVKQVWGKWIFSDSTIADVGNKIFSGRGTNHLTYVETAGNTGWLYSDPDSSTGYTTGGTITIKCLG